jgi:hypothetical protein
MTTPVASTIGMPPATKDSDIEVEVGLVARGCRRWRRRQVRAAQK